MEGKDLAQIQDILGCLVKSVDLNRSPSFNNVKEISLQADVFLSFFRNIDLIAR